MKLITPLLVGPAQKIKRIAQQAKININAYEIVDVEHSEAAAEQAVALVRAQKAQMLMKGSLHTDEFMHTIIDKELGLRTGRRMSHVFIAETRNYNKLLLITDCALNIAPHLTEKKDIVQNAIDLADALNIHHPKVAILSAIETVTERIQSTIDAAALCKMADRGQITGGILDGPLAFDNAISKEAAKIKHIRSDVAGNADILLAPDLEAGNMIAKQLQYLGNAKLAGIVIGARVPLVLTSRSDDTEDRIVSCALGIIYLQHLHQGKLCCPL
jgi:phosphotransacetylase